MLETIFGIIMMIQVYFQDQKFKLKVKFMRKYLIKFWMKIFLKVNCNVKKLISRKQNAKMWFKKKIWASVIPYFDVILII